MANPQKENGYTPIANEILDALCRIRISGEARQVLDVVLRKTYGFNKKEDRIALSQLCLGTGLKKSTVCKAVVKLAAMNLVTKKGNDTGSLYRFNKDFDTWKPLPKKVTLPKKVIIVTKKGNNRYQKRDIQKTVSKDTITKDILATSFESFWASYPRKVSRKKTEQIWKRIPVFEHDAIFKALAVARGSPQWVKDGGQFIPHPTTWLNQERWKDETTHQSLAQLQNPKCKGCGKESSSWMQTQYGTVCQECALKPVNPKVQSLKAEMYKSMTAP